MTTHCCTLHVYEFHEICFARNVLTVRCPTCLSGMKQNLSSKLDITIITFRPLWVFQSNYEHSLWASAHEEATPFKHVHVEPTFCWHVFLTASRRCQADGLVGQGFTCCFELGKGLSWNLVQRLACLVSWKCHVGYVQVITLMGSKEQELSTNQESIIHIPT